MRQVKRLKRLRSVLYASYVISLVFLVICITEKANMLTVGILLLSLVTMVLSFVKVKHLAR